MLLSIIDGIRYHSWEAIQKALERMGEDGNKSRTS